MGSDLQAGDGKTDNLFYSVHTEKISSTLTHTTYITSASPSSPCFNQLIHTQSQNLINVVTSLRLDFYTFSEGAILFGKPYEGRLNIMPLSSLIICYLQVINQQGSVAKSNNFCTPAFFATNLISACWLACILCPIPDSIQEG